MTRQSDTSLAGVPIDESFVTQVREKLESILSTYKNTFITSTCSNWTKPEIIKQADSAHTQTVWTVINNGLLLPKHFTELKSVADLLTVELDACPCGCTNLGLLFSEVPITQDSPGAPHPFAAVDRN